MTTATFLADAFRRSLHVIQLQADGMTQADSLVQLPFRGNCMNWLVGHVVTNRGNVFRLLGHESLADPAVDARYGRESEPIAGEGPGIFQLEDLLSMLERMQAQLEDLLGSVSRTELDRQVAFFGNRSMSVEEWLLFFYFHDSYHAGQTEILRQAAGKDDRVI